jgi:hypothetical protein
MTALVAFMESHPWWTLIFLVIIFGGLRSTVVIRKD